MLQALQCYEEFGVRIERMEVSDATLILTASSTHRSARCPHCQTLSTRIGGWYWRKPADLPWMGQRVHLHLRVRRFVCDQATCPHRTFGERFPALVSPYARRTDRLTDQQQQVGFAVGGEAGARLLSRLGMMASPDTLLRQVRNAPEQTVTTPRVLGIDDWALRKGQTYGTILVDLEEHRVVDLLPDRTADTVAQWLQAHPGVEIITRDRATDYAEGATRGAPAAIQVADRFHLLQNLTDTLQRLFDRHPQQLREVVRQVTETSAKDESPSMLSRDAPAPLLPCPAPTGELVERQGNEPPQTARQLRFAEVKALQQQGWSRRAVARELGMSSRTINKYWHWQEMPKRHLGAQSISSVTPYLSYLQQHWQAGCQTRKQLYAELKAQGYTGSYMSVWRATDQLVQEGVLVASQKQSIRTRTFSARKAAWLWVAQPDDLPLAQQGLREKLCQVCQVAEAAYELAQAFCQMIRNRQVDVLDEWLQRAVHSKVPELQRFAAGLRRDYAAVRAALQHRWSNGQVEGHVNRLKLVKRAMFGRAKFDLLRKRVLGFPMIV